MSGKDSVGMPFTDYASFGRVSNRDLYYLKCSDLKKHFGSLSGMRVAEIGPGYGGNVSLKPIILLDIRRNMLKKSWGRRRILCILSFMAGLDPLGKK